MSLNQAPFLDCSDGTVGRRISIRDSEGQLTIHPHSTFSNQDTPRLIPQVIELGRTPHESLVETAFAPLHWYSASISEGGIKSEDASCYSPSSCDKFCKTQVIAVFAKYRWDKVYSGQFSFSLGSQSNVSSGADKSNSMVSRFGYKLFIAKLLVFIYCKMKPAMLCAIIYKANIVWIMIFLTTISCKRSMHIRQNDQ